MAKIKGAIFDLDGTLLDSDNLWTDIDRIFLRRRGFDLTEEYLENVNSMSFREAAEYTIKRYSLNDSPEGLMSEWNNLAKEAYKNSIALFPYVREYLEKLKRDGVLLSVATDLDREIAISALKNNNILELFKSIHTTKETGSDKRTAKIFLEAAASMALQAEDCIVYEDSKVAIESAKKEGFIIMDAKALHEEARRLFSTN